MHIKKGGLELKRIRRNRASAIVFTIALLLQTVFANVGMTFQVQAEGEKPSSILANGEIVEENEGEAVVQFNWTLDESVNTEDTYTAALPENTTIADEQSGELLHEGEDVGSFSATTEGEVSIQFNDGIAGLAEDATGSFTVNVVVEVEEVEEQAEETEEVAEEDAEEATPEQSEEEGTEEDATADEEDADAEEGSEDDVKEEEKASEEQEDKNKRNVLANEEKHGFKLELDEVLDLDDEAFDEQHPMDPHKEFKLKLDWELEDGHNYVEGDTETFDLPKGIKIKKDIEIELKDEHGQVIANAIVKPDKTVELTFTNFVEGHSAVSGWMEIISALDPEEVDEEDGEIIIDPIGEEGELRIPIEELNKDKTIEKNGQPNKGYNADEINWSVTINKNKTSLENARVVDELPEGTEYKEGSLKVTKLKVDLYGNVLGDGEKIEITPEFGENGELIVPLGDTNDAYRVEYVTEVTDDEEKHFENNATLKDDELDDISAKSTITINRGEPIKKSAVTNYDPKTGIIEWEIEFNYNQKDLSDVTLKDAWTPEGMLELVEDSLKFQEVSIDENGNAHHEGDAINLPDGANLNVIDDGFEVDNISTDKAYKVTYQTKVKDRVLDPEDVSNTAGFGSEWDSSGTHVGQYYGAKSAGTIDYAEKTIDWTIRINHDEYPMENISIEDTLGDGLTLLEDSMEVTVGGESYEGYTLSGDNPFKIDFPEDYTTDKEIIITYKTEFDADEVPDNKATNKADITWTPEGEKDSITKEVGAEKPLNKETADYSWKNGSYNPETKEITWEIITNYRENDFTNLIVQDKPQGNQQIIDGSAEVKELNIAANGSYTDGDTVEDAATIDEEANTLTVNLGETSKAYKITYKTSLEGLDDMQDEYVNEAEVLDGDEVISEIDAKVGVVKDSKYGDKSGYQDGKQIHWSIDVNLVQQKIKDLKLVDKISENQEFLEDSIKVYHANIDVNGNASKGEEVSSDDYTLDIDQEAGEFTVKWNNEVERAFIVEYSTLFFEKHNGEVKNDYTITGDSIGEEDSDASGSDDVTIEQLGSGGGEGIAGYLVIDKVDSTHGQEETSLAGAEFDLIDADTGNVLKSGTTDENGQIDFGRLLFGDYQLKETKVPEGYVTPEEEQTITIDKEYKPGDEKETFEYTVENYVPVFAVELSKTDDANNALAGAEFTLFDSDDKELATETTNEEGKILFEDLKNTGTYYVQETKAPAGYVLDETKHEVTIGDKEQEPIKVTAKNATRGNVVLTKTDVDTEEALEGVEFELQKENESGDYEKVGETYTTDENGQIQTGNTLEAGSYQFVEVKPLDGYRTNGEPIKFNVDVNETETLRYEMTNEQHKGSIKLIKKDAATEDLLAGAEFKLVDADGEVVEENLTTNEDGEIVIDDLFLGNYQLIETKAPAGYELDETPIDVEITEDEQVVEKDATNNQITEISVEKKWNNAGGDTESVTVKLLPTDQTAELNEENDWQATFEDLYVYDESGEEIDYQVEELEVDGYNSVVTGDSSDGFIVTNTETTSVSGEKTWLDDLDEHSAITVELLANGTKVADVEVNEDTDWKYAFTELDKFDESGEEITYTIEEVEVEGYDTNIDATEDGFDITNLRVGETEVSGTKTWLDDNSAERPESITVNLLANDEEIDDVKVTAESDWKYEFTELPKYDDQGVEITYTVDEEVVEGYKKSIDGNDITNLRVGTTEVDVTKLWKDENETDRPDTIKVNLLQNGEFYEEYEVTKENEWELTITDLPQYDDEGVAYEYTVTEHDVPGYASDVDGFEITNTRSDVKSIEITKTWLDNDSKNRPDSIEVELYRSVVDGDKELVDTVTVTKEDGWSLEVSDLPAFDAEGKAYTYEVEEKAIEGYETSVNGFELTNLRVGETEVLGTKTWLDDDSADRPDSITVNLLANGEQVDKVDVTAESDWEYSFTELPKYDNQGVEITYTVDEEAVEGYEKSIDDNDITNLRVGTTEVEITKLWKDENETDRPDTIKVNLLQNGEFYKEYEVTKENEWELTVTDLPQYDDEGVAYEYTVTEHDVPGYASEVDGFEITNTRSDVKSIEITKTWLDDDSKARPDSIEVELYRSVVDGEKELVDTFTVTKEDDWSLEVADLPAFDADGKAYTYEIEEKAVEGYETSINGFDLTNLRVGETEVSGTKTWKDDQASDRPESITVELFANGEKVDSIEVTAEMDWTYSFEGLAGYDAEGKAIEYTVNEVEVDGYETTINGYDITNTLIPEDPEEPKDPEKPTTPEDPSGSDKPGDKGDGDTLPKTATDIFNFLLAGLLLLGAGFTVFFIQRRRA